MKCMICGKEMKHNHYSKYSDFFGLCGDTECFNKRFWQLAIDDKAVIINGTCYHIGKEADSRYTNDLGFDGRVFHIKMLDTGEVITTNNLRCNGKVPKEYTVEDNAVFLGGINTIKIVCKTLIFSRRGACNIVCIYLYLT